MWSWVLACIGVTGIYFVGRKTIWGWLVLLFNECLWIIYAVSTRQYGFIFAALAYAATYIKSYIHWSKEPVNLIHKPEELSILCYNCGGTYKVKYGESRIHVGCINSMSS
jgi:hypothetical protein